MRIITGKYKGRHFDISRSFKARPTTDFAKENIFNVLTAYIDFEEGISGQGCEALDLFAGTGSITLELLSRGCAHVVSVELDRDHHRFISSCILKLGWREEGGRWKENTPASDSTTDGILPPPSTLLLPRNDVFRFIKSCKQQFDFIFADPPYALKELPQIPDLVLNPQTSNLLKPGGIFVFEHGKDHDFSHHPRFVEHRAYGSVNFSLFR